MRFSSYFYCISLKLCTSCVRINSLCVRTIISNQFLLPLRRNESHLALDQAFYIKTSKCNFGLNYLFIYPIHTKLCVLNHIIRAQFIHAIMDNLPPDIINCLSVNLYHTLQISELSNSQYQPKFVGHKKYGNQIVELLVPKVSHILPRNGHINAQQQN